MKFVAVCACPAGLMHTFMAAKGLKKEARKGGDEIAVETQSASGIENEITKEEAREADVVLLAVEVGIAKRERFEGKPTVNIPVQTVVKSPETVLKKIEEKLKNR